MENNKKHQAYAVLEDGRKVAIDAKSLVIEMACGEAVEIDLEVAPYPGAGLSVATPPYADRDQRPPLGWPRMVVRPGAANLLELCIEPATEKAED